MFLALGSGSYQFPTTGITCSLLLTMFNCDVAFYIELGTEPWCILAS